MKTFNLKLFKAFCMIAIVLAWGNSLSSAQTIAPMVTNFDYSNYTFQYTEGGETKTANLTDEATTPDHIIALLKAVYTDKTIPGIHYGYNYNGTTDNLLNYLNNANQGTPWTLGTADATNYPNPDQDGMTLLLVQLNEDWTSKTPGANWSDWTYINRAYSSVKLITNFTRVHDANNPGYLFSIDGAANRFFFISKGKTRNTYTRPLHRLFEQISPVNTNNHSYATTNFIDSMRNGNSYLCYHDCGDVGTVDDGHWFTISNTGEAFSLKNLTIFIPDRRLEDNRASNSSQASNSDYYCFYGGKAYNHTAVMPKVLMYTASLEATATPSETNGYYQVNLDWDTSFTPEKLGVDVVPQHYYVYILNEDNTRTLIEDVAKDPVNNLVVTKHHDYLIQQTTDPQTIKYVIEAQTINYYNDGNIIYKDSKPLITLQAESPVRSITIPGYYPFFTQVSEYRSRYDVTNEVNIYKNKLSIRPTNAEDFVALKNNQEEYNVTRTDANGDKVTIATVQFTQKEGQEGQEGYNYTVNYNAETQVTEGLVFDNEVPTTHGTINDFAGSTVFVIDRFTASTQTNEQSDKYTYKFEQNEGNYSNPLTVPVYKTTSTVNGVGYTNAQITSDTDHSLRAAPCNEITFHAIYDPSANLSDYYVYRLGDKDNYAVGKAEHFNNNGEYHVYVVGTDGHLNVQTGIQHFTQEGGDITVTDQNQSVADEESRYVPVITTHYGGDQNKPNTYGCDIKSVSYPQVILAENGMMKTDPFAGSTGPMLGYLVKLGITPKLPSDINYVYYYRLWRVVENQEGAPTQFSNEILLNLEKNNSGQDAHGQTLWASDYDDIRDFYPGNDDKQVDDIFLDWVFNGKKEVKYIVRLYATYIPGDNPGEGSDSGFGDDIDQIPAPSPAPAIATPKANDGKDYFIAEDIIIIKFNNLTPTAVGTINVEAQPVSVTYYNMLGVGSSRPHPGVNVMVTRYNDGTTSTTKVIR